MANPLPGEKGLYERIQSEGLSIDKATWDFIYHRVNDNIAAIILICQRWLTLKEAMPADEARRILVWTKDIKNAINAVTSPSKESLPFPQFHGMIPISPIIQELVTHQFGNDLYAMELILQNAIDPIDPGPIVAGCLQKILNHALSMQEFVESLRETSQWKDSEEKYRKLYESFSDALFLVDMKGSIIDVNQACLNMFGYSREEIKKLVFRDLTLEKWRDKEASVLQNQILKRGYCDEYEKENIKKGNNVFSVSQKAWLIENKQGEPLGMWVVIRDITERKNTEKLIIENLLDSQRVIDKISDGITVSDAKGHFAVFNVRMQEITGYTVGEANRQNDFNMLLYPNPNDRQEALRGLSEIVAKKGYRETQATIQAKDGSEKILWVSTTLISYKNIDMYLSVWRDITERKRLESALQDSETRFRRLFETAQDGILILDADTGQIREVNPFLIDMLDYSREEFLGKKLWEVGAFIDIEKSKAAFLELQTKGYVRYEDLPLRTKDGRLINVEFVSNVYAVDHTKVIQCNIRDITERKKAEEAVLSLSKFPSENPNPVLRIDHEGTLIYKNQSTDDRLKELGLSENKIYEFLPKNISELINRALETKKVISNIEVQIQDKSYSFNIAPIPENKYANLYVEDITERKRVEEERILLLNKIERANKELEQLALKDSHTGLYNHRYLKEAIEVSFARAERLGTSLSVIMMDIDYFKSINDVYGHVFGDLVLRQFAAVLTKAVRPYDVVIRYGGEEFIIVSADTDRSGAQALAKRILEKVGLYSFGDRAHSVKLKLSLAVANYPQDSIHNSAELVDYADQILNKAKENGGNRVYSSLDIKKEAETVENSSDIHSLKEKIGKLTIRANQSLIEETLAFAKTIDLKDHYTGKHVERTVNYAAKISQELHFPNDKIELIREAAMLHDLGKVGIAEHILHKKSKLSREEFEEVKKHPQIGVDIIRPIHSLHPIIPFLLHHHERWDGKGYPHGLAGERIPLGARIIAIADVYQALVSNRPYRKAYSKKKAVQIIKEASGTQFDPDIVNAFSVILQREQ